MLLEAHRVAASGRRVIVVGMEATGARALESMLARMGLDHRNITVVGSGNGEYAPRIDWEKMRLTGKYSDRWLMVDHDVIERRLRKAMEMYHRFDRCPETEPSRETFELGDDDLTVDVRMEGKESVATITHIPTGIELVQRDRYSAVMAKRECLRKLTEMVWVSTMGKRVGTEVTFSAKGGGGAAGGGKAFSGGSGGNAYQPVTEFKGPIPDWQRTREFPIVLGVDSGDGPNQCVSGIVFFASESDDVGSCVNCEKTDCVRSAGYCE
jgi:hypothetical protein